MYTECIVSFDMVLVKYVRNSILFVSSIFNPYPLRFEYISPCVRKVELLTFLIRVPIACSEVYTLTLPEFICI